MPCVKQGHSMALRKQFRSNPAMAVLQNFQTFVFLDVETTGLRRDQPHVSELCLFAVHRFSLQSVLLDLPNIPRLPRIIDKLVLCIDPQKPFIPAAEEITGLCNRTLEENCKSGFNKAVVEAVDGFLNRQAGPVCLVAHNGLDFDFPLLRAELQQVGSDLPPNVGCLDTLLAFKDMEKSAHMRFRLGDLYYDFYEEEPAAAHSAEGDVVSLLLVFLARAPELMTWAALNACTWEQIQPMKI
uniref:exodeoxyribonuclease III n=1 Tax=Salvator merianae TaxID=96440 RepID=A0A8D0CC49_SALMN